MCDSCIINGSSECIFCRDDIGAAIADIASNTDPMCPCCLDSPCPTHSVRECHRGPRDGEIEIKGYYESESDNESDSDCSVSSKEDEECDNTEKPDEIMIDIED